MLVSSNSMDQMDQTNPQTIEFVDQPNGKDDVRDRRVPTEEEHDCQYMEFPPPHILHFTTESQDIVIVDQR